MLRICKMSILTLLLLLVSQNVLAVRTDIVYLHNGDRITGEVKTLIRGMLEFKTDHMGTLLIEWDEILEIVSTTGQSVELTNGQRFYGPLAKPEGEDMLAIKTPQGQVGVSTLDVIAMYPVEATFWERLDLSASLGFSWDKGSNVGKYNLGIDADYRRPQSITNVGLSMELTTQNERDSTKRANFNAMHNVFMGNKRFRSWFGNLEHNDELGIDLRALAGFGYGWVPIRSQRNLFTMAAGLDINHEIPTEGDAENNIEAVGLISYEYYKYSTPERTFKVHFRVFPSVTDFGRWRANLTSDFRLELVTDLFWKMEIYADYDSNPISSEAATSDYGVVSGISYKF